MVLLRHELPRLSRVPAPTHLWCASSSATGFTNFPSPLLVNMRDRPRPIRYAEVQQLKHMMKRMVAT